MDITILCGDGFVVTGNVVLQHSKLLSEHFKEVCCSCSKTVILPDVTKDTVSLAITLIESDVEPAQHLLETVAPVYALLEIYRKPITEECFMNEETGNIEVSNN